jgi:hypothetical protein
MRPKFPRQEGINNLGKKSKVKGNNKDGEFIKVCWNSGGVVRVYPHLAPWLA